jgi:hypothetical protein
LAARYFRVIPRARHRRLVVELKFDRRLNRPDLQVAIRNVNPDDPKPSYSELKPEQSGSSEVQTRAVITPSRPDQVDHYIVIVANCGVCAVDGWPGRVHDDHREFDLSVWLED